MDLADFKVETTTTYVGGHERPMYLYLERDVERKAWDKHGGPDGFENYLNKLLSTHQKRGTKRPFRCPDGYLHLKVPSAPSVCIMSVPPEWLQSPSANRVGHSPILARFRDAMPQWLWKACNEHIEARCDFGPPSRKAREQLMPAAQAFARRYPDRPAHPLPSSPAVDHLRAVLDDSQDFPGREFDEGRYEDDGYSWEWEDTYVARVYSALKGVIKAHGMGADGLASVRWEVYDKYKRSKCQTWNRIFLRSRLV